MKFSLNLFQVPVASDLSGIQSRTSVSLVCTTAAAIKSESCFISQPCETAASIHVENQAPGMVIPVHPIHHSVPAQANSLAQIRPISSALQVSVASFTQSNSTSTLTLSCSSDMTLSHSVSSPSEVITDAKNVTTIGCFGPPPLLLMSTATVAAATVKEVKSNETVGHVNEAKHDDESNQSDVENNSKHKTKDENINETGEIEDIDDEIKKQMEELDREIKRKEKEQEEMQKRKLELLQKAKQAKSLVSVKKDFENSGDIKLESKFVRDKGVTIIDDKITCQTEDTKTPVNRESKTGDTKAIPDIAIPNCDSHEYDYTDSENGSKNDNVESDDRVCFPIDLSSIKIKMVTQPLPANKPLENKLTNLMPVYNKCDEKEIKDEAAYDIEEAVSEGNDDGDNHIRGKAKMCLENSSENKMMDLSVKKCSEHKEQKEDPLLKEVSAIDITLESNIKSVDPKTVDLSVKKCPEHKKETLSIPLKEMPSTSIPIENNTKSVVTKKAQKPLDQEKMDVGSNQSSVPEGLDLVCEGECVTIKQTSLSSNSTMSASDLVEVASVELAIGDSGTNCKLSETQGELLDLSKKNNSHPSPDQSNENKNSNIDIGSDTETESELVLDLTDESEKSEISCNKTKDIDTEKEIGNENMLSSAAEETSDMARTNKVLQELQREAIRKLHLEEKDLELFGKRRVPTCDKIPSCVDSNLPNENKTLSNSKSDNKNVSDSNEDLSESNKRRKRLTSRETMCTQEKRHRAEQHEIRPAHYRSPPRKSSKLMKPEKAHKQKVNTKEIIDMMDRSVCHVPLQILQSSPYFKKDKKVLPYSKSKENQSNNKDSGKEFSMDTIQPAHNQKPFGIAGQLIVQNKRKRKTSITNERSLLPSLMFNSLPNTPSPCAPKVSRALSASEEKCGRRSAPHTLERQLSQPAGENVPPSPVRAHMKPSFTPTDHKVGLTSYMHPPSYENVQTSDCRNEIIDLTMEVQSSVRLVSLKRADNCDTEKKIQLELSEALSKRQRIDSDYNTRMSEPPQRLVCETLVKPRDRRRLKEVVYKEIDQNGVARQIEFRPDTFKGRGRMQRRSPMPRGRPPKNKLPIEKSSCVEHMNISPRLIHLPQNNLSGNNEANLVQPNRPDICAQQLQIQPRTDVLPFGVYNIPGIPHHQMQPPAQPGFSMPTYPSMQMVPQLQPQSQPFIQMQGQPNLFQGQSHPIQEQQPFQGQPQLHPGQMNLQGQVLLSPGQLHVQRGEPEIGQSKLLQRQQPLHGQPHTLQRQSENRGQPPSPHEQEQSQTHPPRGHPHIQPPSPQGHIQGQQHSFRGLSPQSSFHPYRGQAHVQSVSPSKSSQGQAFMPQGQSHTVRGQSQDQPLRPSGHIQRPPQVHGQPLSPPGHYQGQQSQSRGQPHLQRQQQPLQVQPHQGHTYPPNQTQVQLQPYPSQGRPLSQPEMQGQSQVHVYDPTYKSGLNHMESGQVGQTSQPSKWHVLYPTYTL